MDLIAETDGFAFAAASEVCSGKLRSMFTASMLQECLKRNDLGKL